MNISVTNKRLLAGLMAVALACVSSQAFAAGSDDFESPTYTAPEYVTNNVSWSNAGNGLSTVIATNYSYSAATMPLSASAPGTTHGQVLSLDTQGDELDYADAPTTAGDVYVDQMVYLVPSDTPPTITDDSVQAAVYLNSDSNLVLYCSDNVSATPVSGWIVFEGQTVLPETWSRLTISMDYDNGDISGFVDTDWFKVQIDGTDITSTNGHSAVVADPDAIPGPWTAGPWIRCANLTGGSATLNALSGLSYTGTGMLDDLIVTTTAPTFVPGGSTFTITTVVGADGSIDVPASLVVDSGATTSIVFTANQYFELATLYTNNAMVALADHTKVWTSEFANVSSDISNNVAFTETLSTSGATEEWLDGLVPPVDYMDDGSLGNYSFIECMLAGIAPAVSNSFAISDFGFTAGTNLWVQWPGVASPLTADAVDSSIAVVINGTTTNLPGAAVFAGGTWTWTSDDAILDDVLFIQLIATDE